MKLAVQYKRTNILITLGVLIVGAAIYFFAINYIAKTQLDNNLAEEIEEVEEYVAANHQLPKQVDFDEDQTSFIKTDQKNFAITYFDTAYTNVKEKKTEPGRAVSGPVRVQGVNYKAVIIVSRESTEYLVQFIALITLGLMVGLLIVLFLANRYFLNDLWKPFYHLLQQIKSFSLTEDRDFKLSDNRIDEFAELSAAIDSMSSRVRNDYQNLKHITDNASHEMLTPLAVITSKLDTLIQHRGLPADIYEPINDMYAATSKLSRLNQTLLLLTKIENNLINDNEQFDLKSLIEAKTRQFQELISDRHIHCTENLQEKQVLISKYLIDILLNNLFSNAIRHNNEHGQLLITLDEISLTFSNTGSTQPLDHDHIFERFQKGNKSEGAGLGLTLVSNICQLYRWNITYAYQEPYHHIFQITFGIPE
jgi:signal transduction histidine kinase